MSDSINLSKDTDEAGNTSGGLEPENIIWIFGAARTGSTWLSRMMGELPRHTVWREPLVGALFGDFYYERAAARVGGRGRHHIMGDGYRGSWLPSVRGFVLKEAESRFPRLARPGFYLVVKEPNGSSGAPLLMEALPESRMILLVRDPRDAVASGVDAWREGGWQERKGFGGDPRALERMMLASLAKDDPDAFAGAMAERYMRKMARAVEAYEAHGGPKALVRYEDLRADVVGVMTRVYSDLGVHAREGALRRAAEKHSWEKIPDEEKGEGKIRRKAAPGSFGEDLTPGQVEVVERVCAPILWKFYGQE